MEKFITLNLYEAEYKDNDSEILYAKDDKDALVEALNFEFEYGILLNLFEVDNKYNRIKRIK